MLHNVFGADLSRKGNLAFISEHEIIYATGYGVAIENIIDRKKKHIVCLDDGGVGCVAVHPSRYADLLYQAVIGYIESL